MTNSNKLYAIMERFDDEEKFFNGLLRPGNYNKNYKLSVFKNLKTAENRLAEIQSRYQRWIDEDESSYYRHDYRLTGELTIKEFTNDS